MSKVSILIAVYNASEFLSECLDSVLKQTYRNIQVICIDDGSTDNSLDILREYASKDNRVTVISLPVNMGQAHARNEGLKVADGDLICMLDADDWFAPDSIALAVEEFSKGEETDCVLFEVVMSYPGHETVYPLPSFERMEGREAFRLSLTWKLHGLYMVRTSIHRDYSYDETCRLYSDDNTTRIHYLASRYVRCCKGKYYYRQHALSSTRKVSVRRFDYLKANESMKRQMICMGIDKHLLAEYEEVRWLNLIDVYMFYHCCGKNLTDVERTFGMSELKRVWDNIDMSVLPAKYSWKFGYIHMSSWRLFRIQEWLYFTLRSLLGRNNIW